MMLIAPELFVCPISLDIMSDPVTLSTTARTYDGPNIRRWLAAGHRTCPVTMLPLPKSESKQVLLVPNRTLKYLIDRWVLTGRTLSISDLVLPTLKDNLLLLLAGAEEDAIRVTEETLRIVRSLSPPGFCALLLRLLLRCSSHDHDDDGHAHGLLVELALDCLLASPSADELGAALQTCDAASLVLLLGRGSLRVKTGLCRLIHIAADAMTEQQQLCSMVLSRSEQFMGALAALVHDGGAASDAALSAMSSLICSSEQPIRETAVAAGAVDALISYISYSTGAGVSGHCRKTPPCAALLSRALETLEQVLVSVDAGRQAMYTRRGATAVLVKMVFRMPFDDQGSESEHAMGSLLVACRESAAVRLDAINAGLLTQLLLLLQSRRASPRAEASALALLKLLRAIWARH